MLGRRGICGIALAWAIAGSAHGGAAVAAEPPDAPSAPIHALNAVLLEAMRNAETLGFAGRYALIGPVADRVFDFALMTRVAVGRPWRSLDADQRTRLVELFTRYSISTFAERFDGFSGEEFQVLAERPALRNSVLVENQLVKSSGEVVPINYLMRSGGGAWRAVDILLDAKYSELAVRRSEYTAILGRDGVAGLIARMEEVIAQIWARAGA